MEKGLVVEVSVLPGGGGIRGEARWGRPCGKGRRRCWLHGVAAAVAASPVTSTPATDTSPTYR
jgi:hypothetical protein